MAATPPGLFPPRASWALSPGRRNGRWWKLLAGLTLLALALWLILPTHEVLPDFREFEAGPERKQAFLSFLLPYAEEANADILETRERILQLQERWEDRGRLGRGDRAWLRAQAKKAGMDVAEDAAIDRSFFTAFVTRVDIIPPSLALSQAALESGWGTSRFAREGNNLFGIWCYEPGCGIVPSRRSAGAKHEVKVYDSPRESFLDYIWNLNRNPAYHEMRRIRRVARINDRPVLGVELALGLTRYSQEGSAYVSKVSSLIRSNDLTEHDQSPSG